VTTAEISRPTVLRARTAVIAAFATAGLAFASLAARTPAVRETLGLTTAQLGLLLLCLSIGSVGGLPASGPIVQRFGTARSIVIASSVLGFGFALMTAGFALGIVAPAAVGLLFVGFGTGLWDVAMNVEGADVERRLGRSLMPRLHAAFSLGTVAGAGIGTAATATGVPLAVQSGVIAVVAPVAMLVATPRFLPRAAPAVEGSAGGGGVLAAWREPRTLLVGLLVLAFAFAEGSANDWIAIALVDGHAASATVGGIAFGLFVAAMTAGRLAGGSMLERFGRVAVLRTTAVIAMAGLALVVFGGSAPVALAGALLWGVGASLGFPVGMSAGADDPARAAARVSVVSSIGYVAFLAGPPLIGLLAQADGILTALLVVLGALVLGLAASGAARPLR
jgi:fucose permease